MPKNFLGTLILIVGNSGSGKDSIISGVIRRYPSHLKQLYAPKRYITRPPSEAENNILVSQEEFRKMELEGKFVLKWHIYGLDYGIPYEIEEWLKNGHPVIVNVSRTIIKEAKEKYNNVKVVFVEVPLEITLQRIKKRHRESKNSLKERIERAKNNQKFPEADFIVDNSGELDDAIYNLLDYLIGIVRNIEK